MMSSKINNIIERYKQRTISVQSKTSTLELAEGSDELSEVEKKRVRGCSPINISVEPLLFCLTFVMNFSQGVLLNMLERNACVHQFNLTVHQCSSKEFINGTMKSYLEKEAAQISLAIQLIQGLFPVAMSLFIGPWSDKNGRKFFITFPFLGYFIYFLLWGVLSFYPDIAIRYLLIPAIPLSLTGGFVAALVCCYCYLCDIFDAEERTFRFNIAMSCFLAGGLLANLTVSQVFTAGGDYGYALVFFINSFVSAFSFLYAWLCLKETIDTVKGSRFLFSWQYAKSVFVVLIMRPTGELIVILLTVAILVSEILLKSGESSVEYLIGKSQFSWTLETFTYYSSYTTVVAVLCSVLGSLLLKKIFHCKNPTIILVSAIILTASEILKGFSRNHTMFWFSSGLSKAGALIGPTIIAEMSNVVRIEDLGKIYAFNALTESGSAYLSTPLFMSLYGSLIKSNDTIHVFFLSAGISLIIVLAAVCLIFNKRSYQEDSYIVNRF